MADLPSRQEMFRRARAAAIATPGSRISPREIDRPGSDANLLAAMMSLLGEEIVTRMAQQFAGVFEDSATGSQLDRVIFDRKGLARKPSTPAIGTVQLSRPTFAAGAGTIDGGLPGSGPPTPMRIGTNAGVIYVITAPPNFGALALGPITVPVQAELAGLASEVEANQAWSFLGEPFDTSITIANPNPTAGAAEQEPDDAYKARAKAFFPTVRRGTLDAILFGLLSAPGIATASVAELLNPIDGFPANVVRAFVLDALGQMNEVLAARALLSILEFRAAGIPVVIEAGVPQYISIRIVLQFNAALVLDTLAATNAVKAAIVSALSNQNPGELLYRSTIIAAARSVLGVIVTDASLITPAGDFAPGAANIAFRAKAELITTT